MQIGQFIVCYSDASMGQLICGSTHHYSMSCSILFHVSVPTPEAGCTRDLCVLVTCLVTHSWHGTCQPALPAQAKELEKLQKLAALPSEQEALSDRYSRFDEATGEPTHDKDGQPLEGKVGGGAAN